MSIGLTLRKEEEEQRDAQGKEVRMDGWVYGWMVGDAVSSPASLHYLIHIFLHMSGGKGVSVCLVCMLG